MNENLPIFTRNCREFKKIKDNYNIYEDYKNDYGANIPDKFGHLSFFVELLLQKHIDKYNDIVGKINQIINKYNQNKDENLKTPIMKYLYKQILSDKDSRYQFDIIENDKQLFDYVDTYYNKLKEEILDKKEFEYSITNINKFDRNKIFINNDNTLTSFSKSVFGDWSYMDFLLKNKYKGKKEIKKIKVISYEEIENLLSSYDSENDNLLKFQGFFAERFKEIKSCIEKEYKNYVEIQKEVYTKNSKLLLSNDIDIEKIKNLLDSIKSLQDLVKFLIPKDNTIVVDNNFYNVLNYEILEKIISLYNKVRNYVTQKSYSTEKLKLTFNYYKLLNGWDLYEEEKNLGILLRKNNKYYLGIIDKKYKSLFSKYNDNTAINDFYEKMEYKSEKSNKHKEKGYQINFRNISCQYIDKCVDEGKLYLFEIYNKDFSGKSKGIPNLHTLYWKTLFDKDNLKDVIYKLNGNAEVFYRKKSIPKKITHPKDIEIERKQGDKSKKSKFHYDIIKDRRFTIDNFLFHVPITLNFKEDNPKRYKEFNKLFNNEIKNSKDLHIIGIDRGENNLLYVSVIDLNGNIKYQNSLNVVKYKNNDDIYEINYQNILDDREKERYDARRSWKTIKNIKEIKEGYMSQVVHILSKLVIKYNGIIVLEDLNDGFKRSRIKIEKQIYDKFETKLINKLSYLVDKSIKDKFASGGILKAYQLAQAEKTNTKQNGIIFYISPSYTSKIDPTTGFINLFNTKKVGKDFINKFESIIYNKEENYFEFYFDYSKFSDKSSGIRQKWTLCTYGDRINKWGNETINLTDEFKILFSKYNIDYNNISDIKEEISNKSDNKFFSSDKSKDGFYGFTTLFKLLVQLRNSNSNTKEDYIISPVKNKKGEFFRSKEENRELPIDADANGAYNIAKKGLIIVDRIKKSNFNAKVDYVIKNDEWLTYLQANDK